LKSLYSSEKPLQSKNANVSLLKPTKEGLYLKTHVNVNLSSSDEEATTLRRKTHHIPSKYNSKKSSLNRTMEDYSFP